MKSDVQRIYEKLKYWGLTSNQYDFSRHWLGQCGSYFSSIKSQNKSVGMPSVFTLLTRLKWHQQLLVKSNLQRSNSQMERLNEMLVSEISLLEQNATFLARARTTSST